jgi:hypothetical protein
MTTAVRAAARPFRFSRALVADQASDGSPDLRLAFQKETAPHIDEQKAAEVLAIDLLATAPAPRAPR